MGVARTRLNPEVEAGMRQQEEQAQQRREQAAASAPAVRPVGRPPKDPASRPPPKEKRPVGRPRASTHVQAPLPEVPAAGATAAGGQQQQQQQQQLQEGKQELWLRLEVHLNYKSKPRVKALLRVQPFSAKKSWSQWEKEFALAIKPRFGSSFD